MNLMAKAQYDEARGAFRAYADANPDDTIWRPRRSTGSATSPMCSRIMPSAARAFAEVIKKYPKSRARPTLC